MPILIKIMGILVSMVTKRRYGTNLTGKKRSIDIPNGTKLNVSG